MAILLPPLIYNWELNGFIWYLHSFWHITCKGLTNLKDTLVISKCIWQSTCNILQIIVL